MINCKKIFVLGCSFSHHDMSTGPKSTWPAYIAKDNPEYFIRYTSRGSLIYIINKKTGLKVACFKSFDENTYIYGYIRTTNSRNKRIRIKRK